MLLAEVILPLPVQSNYSYRIKEEQAQIAAEGKRVLAPFGRNKTYTGVIKRLYEGEDTDENRRLREVIDISDEYPILFSLQFRLFEWIAFYYMCTEGEVLKAALPIGLKPKSNQYIVLADEVSDIDELLAPEIEQTLFGEEKHYDAKFDDKEITLLMALFERGEIFVEEVAEIWEIENVTPRLKKMQEKGIIRIKQKMEEKYKPKTRSYLHLREEYKNEEKLQAVFHALQRAPAQENLLLRIVSDYFQGKAAPKNETLKELKISPAAAQSLIDKGIIEEKSVQVERMPILENTEPLREITLNAPQQVVYDEIMTSFTENVHKPVLLHGITGSGKTHVYTTLMKEYLKEGKQILYLLPEISITQQIIQRVKRELGNTVGVYHSRFNDNERVEIWHKVCTRQYDVVIGVRSAIFLPFENLGLIIVDEEHDRSFKQDDPSPRYNARDLAIWLARAANCPILLGSATPSFETYHNALTGKYQLVELMQRAVAAQLPEMHIVDMRVETKQKTLKGVFSSVLRSAMQTALEKGEQVILFQNRRGYSPYLQCSTCGHIPQCVNCDISLTYHKDKNYAKCHYCAHSENLDSQCPECGNHSLKKQGAGDR
ncbi:MAG: primosomal protein N', partial [Bacteroidia bacterium]